MHAREGKIAMENSSFCNEMGEAVMKRDFAFDDRGWCETNVEAQMISFL
jgi:hypothetical protein